MFQELEQFVCSLDRYDDRFVEETFAEYAIERLEVSIFGVTRLTDMFLPTHLRVLLPHELETYYNLYSVIWLFVCEHISPIIKLCQEVWDTSVHKLCVCVCVCVCGWVVGGRCVSVCVCVCGGGERV